MMCCAMQVVKVVTFLSFFVCGFNVAGVVGNGFPRFQQAVGQHCNCANDYRPVCGSDGQTYLSECYLYCSNNGQGTRECTRYRDGRDYKGKRSTTVNGQRCTPWEYNVGIYPLSWQQQVDPITANNFPDGSLQEAKNYCRNPDNDRRGLWCFTGYGDPNSHGYCDVPVCDNNQRECTNLQDGSDYAGSLSTTEDGRECTSWAANKGIYPTNYETPVDPILDRNFPDGSVEAARNYCRNPDRDPRGLWCFTGYREPYNFGSCSVPFCDDNNDRREVYKVHDGPCNDCQDEQIYIRDCPQWKRLGFCHLRKNFMSKYCKKSCGLCGIQSCEDNEPYRVSCSVWAQDGFCQTSRTFMREHCKKSCGFCPTPIYEIYD